MAPDQETACRKGQTYVSVPDGAGRESDAERRYRRQEGPDATYRSFSVSSGVTGRAGGFVRISPGTIRLCDREPPYYMVTGIRTRKRLGRAGSGNERPVISASFQRVS